MILSGIHGTMGHFYSLISNFYKIKWKREHEDRKKYKIKEMFEIRRQKCPICPSEGQPNPMKKWLSGIIRLRRGGRTINVTGRRGEAAIYTREIYSLFFLDSLFSLFFINFFLEFWIFKYICKIPEKTENREKNRECLYRSFIPMVLPGWRRMRASKNWHHLRHRSPRRSPIILSGIWGFPERNPRVPERENQNTHTCKYFTCMRKNILFKVFI